MKSKNIVLDTDWQGGKKSLSKVTYLKNKTATTNHKKIKRLYSKNAAACYVVSLF